MTDNSYIDEMPVDGVTWFWESNMDFLAWEDIDISKLASLPIDDKIWWAVDQSYGDYSHACTMMSTYSSILSLFNLSEKNSDKDAILAKAVKNWYRIGSWWLISLGVAAACSTWNELYPDKKVLYFSVSIGSPNFKTALDKWYPAVTWYRTSYKYYKDYKADGVVDSKSFDSFVWWHAITAFKWMDGNSWTHLNTYPRGTYNIYWVKYWMDLVNSKTYYPSSYIIIPEGKYNINDLKKKKLVGEIMKLNSKLRHMSSSKTTKKMLQSSNDYFRKAGFKSNP